MDLTEAAYQSVPGGPRDVDKTFYAAIRDRTGDSLRDYGQDTEGGRVHDVLNVFQWTGLNANDEYFMKTSPAQRGDYFEFFAEFDLLVALSTCPGGDLSVPMFGPDAGDALSVCRPLGVEVFSLDDRLLEGWSQPARAAYSGQHGVKH